MPIPASLLSAAARLVGLWVRMPPGAWISVSFECRVSSGRGLRRADHPFREVLPTLVCLGVILSLRNEETVAL
jgi:hypothetical protein